MLFDGRNDDINFVDDYSSMTLEGEPESESSKAKTKHKKSPLEPKDFISEIKNDEKKYKWGNIWTILFFIKFHCF